MYFSNMFYRNRGLKIGYTEGNNMPALIAHEGGTIMNRYSFGGQKLGRSLTDAMGQLVSDETYYGNLVMEKSDPRRILFEDGYIDLTPGQQPVFNYHLKDHLGNVRIVLKPGGNMYGTVVQSNDYFPFGMAYTCYGKTRWDGITEAVAIAFDSQVAIKESPTYTKDNRYLYNGKEEQPMPGKWLDYGARFYDAQLGRWHVIDNKAEKYQSVTPYAYAVNNPVLFIDPDGNEIKVYREEGQNGGKSTVVIQVTGKLVNNSSTTYTSEQLQGYADRLVSSISSSYTGEGEGVNFRAEVNITVATDDNKATSTDHTFTIQDQGKLPGSEGNNGVTGNAVKGDKNVNISQHILDRKEATTGEYAGTGKTEKGLGTLERTGAHELGHPATLDHPATGTMDKNLMHQTKEANAGKTVTETQVLQIEKAYKDNKLNK